MSMISSHNPWVFAFGLLGNIVSFVVFLAPVPTFIRVWKKKSTEGFQSFPYLVALFSAMIWLHYALVKSNDAFLLITINSVGCVIETIYIALYIAFAPKKARRWTLRILFVMNLGGFCLIILLSHFFAKGSNRVKVLGWVCVVFSVSVFAAPLSIMRLVVRTKSVEFMPFYLSFFLTISAVMWLFYGLLLKDFYVAIPNIVGLVFGGLQMLLYVIYKNYKTAVPEDPNNNKKQLPDQINIDIEKLATNKNNINVTNNEIMLQERGDGGVSETPNGEDQIKSAHNKDENGHESSHDHDQAGQQHHGKNVDNNI